MTAFFAQFTIFDYVVISISLFLLIRGAWIGVLRQTAVFLALITGYLLASRHAGALLPLAGDLIENPRTLFLLTFVLAFLLSAVVFVLIGKVLHKVMEITMLTWFDRLLGFLFGALKAYVISALLLMFVTPTLSPGNDLLERSRTVPLLREGALLIQTVIRDERIRKTFDPQQPPLIESVENMVDRLFNDSPEAGQH